MSPRLNLTRSGAATTEARVPRGTVIFRRGDPCRGFHTVISGQVKLGFASPHGVEKVVEIIGAGQGFGEALMFMKRPCIIDAQALTDSLLLHVGSQAVFDALDRNPRLARRILSCLSRRLHGLVMDLEACSLRSSSQRVINYLLGEGACENGERLALPVSTRLIASRLNLAPEHFSRVLHDLVQGGMIRVDKRHVAILAIEALRRYQD